MADKPSPNIVFKYKSKEGENEAEKVKLTEAANNIIDGITAANPGAKRDDVTKKVNFDIHVNDTKTPGVKNYFITASAQHQDPAGGPSGVGYYGSPEMKSWDDLSNNKTLIEASQTRSGGFVLSIQNIGESPDELIKTTAKFKQAVEGKEADQEKKKTSSLEYNPEAINSYLSSLPARESKSSPTELAALQKGAGGPELG